MSRLLTFIAVVFSLQCAFGQFYFPLQPGNKWVISYCGGSIQCEGSSVVTSVLKDSTIMGKKYAFTSLLLPSRFLRQEGNKMFAYDTTEVSEYLLFDFSANYGDTVSVRANKKKFIIANGNNTFTQIDSTKIPPYDVETWTLRDSFGIYRSTGVNCLFCCNSGFVDGKNVTLNIAEKISNTKIPADPVLEQNYPNPFNPSTQIRFALSTEDDVALEIFDLQGKRVVILLSERLSAGWYSIRWDGSRFASGVYIYRLTTTSKVLSTTMTLLK